jgi:predicted amidophosphoribosyltransferase
VGGPPLQSDGATHEIPFVAAIPYPTKALATTPREKRIQQAVFSIKGTGQMFSREKALGWLSDFVKKHSKYFEEFLHRDALLVPVPGHAPTGTALSSANCAGFAVAEELVRQGLGQRICPAITRTKEVVSGRAAGRGKRPSVATHLESLSATAVGVGDSAIVLVDDNVTQGSTAIAALFALRAAGLRGEVRLFAASYTCAGATPEVALPLRGTVAFREGSTHAVRHDADSTAVDAT